MKNEGALEAPLFTSSPSEADIAAFQAWVRERGKLLYRDLAWRNTRDAYAIWISEAMLQQTQVSRVDGRWQRFIARFPSIDALASASNADVLEEWQGMGYNRRALAIKRAADECSAHFAGKLPRAEEELLRLPGIGPATAAGIRAFAYDAPGVYLETNVRAVFLHCFFPDEQRVTDAQLRALVRAACPGEDVRGWYYALLDIGAQLKKTVPNPTRRAASYVKQSKFEGSRRQKRAWLLREVLACPGLDTRTLGKRLSHVEVLAGRAEVVQSDVASILQDLAREGFISKQGEFWFA